jgi:anti-sigma B factor antagonist
MSLTRARILIEESFDGVTVATFADAELLDPQVIGEVMEEVCELAYKLGAVSMLLNFERVRLMSSSMLGVLLYFSRRFRQGGGHLKLCCIAPDLREIFRIASYEGLFEIHSEEFQALEAF